MSVDKSSNEDLRYVIALLIVAVVGLAISITIYFGYKPSLTQDKCYDHWTEHHDFNSRECV